ncbi:MAG: hypothetical protein RLZZ387_4902 [Chloroflexota bacterium]|jgi:hypothetical protein
MLRRVGRVAGFTLANMVVMVVLHGNSRQWWPKIPYLSLRDESVAEHCRLLFNTLAVVTLGQALLGRLPRERVAPRAALLVALPLALPALIALGRHGLRLRPPALERYYLSLVPLLPLLGGAWEEIVAPNAER